MVFEINHFNAKGVLRAGFLFKVEKGICFFYERETWLSCKDNTIGLLPLLHISYSNFLEHAKDKENFIIYFPIKELLVTAITFPSVNKFWAKRAVESWLEDEKFIVTDELKLELPKLDIARLDEDLQNRLLRILS